MIIYLGELLLIRSRDLPGCQTERATPLPRNARCSTLLDLAPGGVCRSKGITALAGSLLHYRFTLADREPGFYSGNIPLCCTFRRVAPPGR